MKKNSISEFELERQDFKIRLKRGGGPPPSPAGYDEAATIYSPPGPGSGGNVSPMVVSSGTLAGVSEVEIKAPMIGTLYRAPSPEAANYVEVGSEVNADSVVCIIEAMKVMNEIKAEVRGIVTQILVENAKPVEFGQPMFKIRPT